MAELHVRNLPADLHERLRNRARRESRPVSAEVVALLRQALEDPEGATRRTDAIARLRRIQQHRPLPPGIPPAEDLVFEDRTGAG